ncbi:hypothetical protein TD95_003923 [Thielaviopsis punctulata]|uniref:2,5-diamino-6-ribosylamino-4(3H)-pyrimidinone 5'-phosphate reductase n=1 Tax=Thielaviopsis punctulata TaxID=72032 RepID=A0A0F4ZC60_9PEZI|nr:hypothetical protein TD95_003923 [Thielaviopsis punctulata]
MSTLEFSAANQAKLEAYMPPASKSTKPFVTLTFATSLDSSLSLAPGVRTRLSGPDSKAMTHYLRSRHAAICIGVGTAVADDPALNCRISGSTLAQQPRPIVIDPQARWEFTRDSKVFEVCRDGKGKAPFVLVAEDTEVVAAKRGVLEEHGGKVVAVPVNAQGQFSWTDILCVLSREGLDSVMVEGGGHIINSLLHVHSQNLIDSVIVTIAPTWLGQGGVVVSPDRVKEGGVAVPAARLKDVAWHPFGEDVVLCGRL